MVSLDQTTVDVVRKVNMNETPNGKAIEIIRNPKTAALELKFTGGGELPLELTGSFTSHIMAQKAINSYLAAKQAKAK